MVLHIATSNPGKLRDFAAAATGNITLTPLPNLIEIPAPAEDEPTFEGNARLKAIYYSRHAPGQIVIADDSGLEVDALHGAPGVRSARYADDQKTTSKPNPTPPPMSATISASSKPSTKSQALPQGPLPLCPRRRTRRKDPRHRRRHRRRRDPHHSSRQQRLRIRPALLPPYSKQDNGRTGRPNQAHLQPPWPSLRRTPQSARTAPVTS